MTLQIIEVDLNQDPVVETTPVAAGIRGPQGPAGGLGYVHTQTVASGTWSINHTIGRRPTVAIYLGSELVDADIFATSAQVVVTFPAPTAGTAVLT